MTHNHGMGEQRTWPWSLVLIIFQSIQALTLVPWLLMAGLSVMVFDAPGSTQMWQPWAFVLAIWSYPFWLLLAGAASWVLHLRGWHKTAAAIAVLLTLPALIFVILLGQ